SLPRPPDAHRVPRREEGLEVGQPLDVIPVRVRQQDLRVHRAVLLPHELQPQWTDPGARVEDDYAPAGSLHGHARGVPAVAGGMDAGGGDRAPRPPKSHRVGLALGHPGSWAKLRKNRHVRQAGVSPGDGDPPHERPAEASSAARSRIRISRRLTSMYPLSTSSRMVRLTVSRLEPIIWAMVWWVRRRVMRFDPPSSARSSSSWATRPFTSSNTRLPTFSSTRRNRRESSRKSASAMDGVCFRMPWKSSRRST